MLTMIFNIWLLSALKMHHLRVLFLKFLAPRLSGLHRPPPLLENASCAPEYDLAPKCVISFTEMHFLDLKGRQLFRRN